MGEREERQFEMVALLECNLDDMTGEELGYALERLLVAGALDVWFTPIEMKKSRPAILLSVLCRPADADRLSEWVLRETTTLGVRRQMLTRLVAERRIESVTTPFGPVRCKLKIVGGRVMAAKPEFEDCAAIARERGLSLHTVLRIAEQACSAHLGVDSPPTDSVGAE
ncbi:MAG: DUF111 family protein [Chloroflexi bacterium]|nr:DUF111 family protein [Chloroflexota bacterium]